jgi:hypothetical protein
MVTLETTWMRLVQRSMLVMVYLYLLSTELRLVQLTLANALGMRLGGLLVLLFVCWLSVAAMAGASASTSA